MMVDLFNIALFDHAAVLHDQNAVAQIVNNVQVMRDEEIAQVQIIPQLLQQLKQWNAEAQAEGRTLAEYALRWILQQQGVTSVLVGASSTKQLERNLRCVL